MLCKQRFNPFNKLENNDCIVCDSTYNNDRAKDVVFNFFFKNSVVSV